LAEAGLGWALVAKARMRTLGLELDFKHAVRIGLAVSAVRLVSSVFDLESGAVIVRIYGIGVLGVRLDADQFDGVGADLFFRVGNGPDDELGRFVLAVVVQSGLDRNQSGPLA